MAASTPEYVTNTTFVVPSAAAGVSITGSGSAFGNSVWTQMIASTSTAITIVGVNVKPGVASEFEIDVGTGAAASEVAIATLCGDAKSLIDSNWFIPFPIAISNVAASTRVSIRYRRSGTTTTAFLFNLVYYANPVSGNITSTANASLVAPSAAAGASVTPGGSWANGTWVQLIASTGSAIIVGGVEIAPGSTGQWECDIGTGASLSEVAITTIRGNTITATGGPWFFPLENPLDNIATTTRVAARMRGANATGAAYLVKLLYYNKPL